MNTNERVEGESGNEARIYCNLLSVVTYALVQWAEYSVKVYCDLVHCDHTYVGMIDWVYYRS